MRASILAIGDEILSGQTTDTNSSFLAEALRAEGVEVVSFFAVPDDPAEIRRGLERALGDADLVTATGGLGPTADDLTTAVVADVIGAALRLDEPSLRRMEERFRARGLEMPANNRKQAMLPREALVVPNPIGTAPGFICPVDRAGELKHVACLPGVPSEMRIMAETTLLPWVRERAPAERFASRVFSTFGLSESALDELLQGAIEPTEARLAFRAAFPRIQARVTVHGPADGDLERRLDELEARVRERLGEHVYATGDAGMEDAVGDVLRTRGLTLAVAESCTGGLIGSRITDVPGSSEYFLGGVVAYANAPKTALLGVREETLARHGAVSTEVAEEMAAGVRMRFGADLGLSTTGIAGPGGGTVEKPIGTVCVGLAWDGGAESRRYDLGSRSREWIKVMTAQVALDRLRRWGARG
jgi:nicotinamide-nucleotide amidase